MWISLNPPMLAWAAALQHAGFFTAILSNMVSDVLRTMLQEFAWLANFNQLTWSCDLGIAKPDPAIYAFTCDRLGVRPDEALFLDDKIENIRGAEAFGLQALQFSTIAQLRHDLAARGLLAGFPGTSGNLKPFQGLRRRARYEQAVSRVEWARPPVRPAPQPGHDPCQGTASAVPYRSKNGSGFSRQGMFSLLQSFPEGSKIAEAPKLRSKFSATSVFSVVNSAEIPTPAPLPPWESSPAPQSAR